MAALAPSKNVIGRTGTFGGRTVTVSFYLHG
jgi:hypothetical protein